MKESVNLSEAVVSLTMQKMDSRLQKIHLHIHTRRTVLPRHEVIFVTITSTSFLTAVILFRFRGRRSLMALSSSVQWRMYHIS